MLWVKAFHIIFVVTWFAGLFYLPRLYVYHAMADTATERARLKIMERRLFGIMTIGGTLAAVFGLWLLHAYAWTAWGDTVWLRAKLLLVGLLIAYHVWCYLLMRAFARDADRHGHVWFRWFNEMPTILLIAIVVLTVVKPV